MPGPGEWGGGDAWWRPPGTATAAGGTHPTGMHSRSVMLTSIFTESLNCLEF